MSLRRFLKDPLLVFGVVFLVALFLFAVFVPGIRTAQLQPKDYPRFDAAYGPIAAPYVAPGVNGAILGTDEQGRDTLARLAQGARVSLMVGFIVQILALGFGMLVGVLGMFAPKWIRMPLLRLTDAMFAFPDILLAILIVSTFAGRDLGIWPVVVALSITAWPSVARLTFTQMASVKDREFVVAAPAAGASTTYLVTRHILPQILPLILAVSMVDMAGTILAESALSFIGIGVQPPNPSWGNMINAVRSGDITSHTLQLFLPCALLSLTIIALNFVGDGLQAIFDPKART